jgi:hypothetical protein
MLKIVLSFDDGRPDFFETVFPILKNKSLVATLHLITGGVDNTYNGDPFACGSKRLTIEELLEMKKYGIEISSHGDKHSASLSDYLISFQKMSDWGLLNNNRVGYSIPHSTIDQNDLKTLMDLQGEMRPLYIRVGRNKKCYTLSSKMQYFLSYYLHSQKAFCSFNNKNVITDIDPYDLCSVVIKSKDSVASIERFLGNNASTDKQDKLVILMFHSIGPTNKDPWTWSKEKFEELVTFLANKTKEGSILVTTLDKAIKS